MQMRKAGPAYDLRIITAIGYSCGSDNPSGCGAKEENVSDTKKVLIILGAALGLGLAGCSNEEQAQNDTSATNESIQSHVAFEAPDVHLDITDTTPGEDTTQEMTPIVAQVPSAPIPFLCG